MATNKQIEEAWNNAHKMRGKNPDVYRKDDHQSGDGAVRQVPR